MIGNLKHFFEGLISTRDSFVFSASKVSTFSKDSVFSVLSVLLVLLVLSVESIVAADASRFLSAMKEAKSERLFQVCRRTISVLTAI